MSIQAVHPMITGKVDEYVKEMIDDSERVQKLRTLSGKPTASPVELGNKIKQILYRSLSIYPTMEFDIVLPFIGEALRQNSARIELKRENGELKAYYFQ